MVVQNLFPMARISSALYPHTCCAFGLIKLTPPSADSDQMTPGIFSTRERYLCSLFRSASAAAILPVMSLSATTHPTTLPLMLSGVDRYSAKKHLPSARHRSS